MSGGGWFDDIGAWAGTQNWLPAFLGGPGDAGLGVGQMGPMPSQDLPMYGPLDPTGMGQQFNTPPVNPAGSGDSWKRYQRALATGARAAQQSQPRNQMTEWFGPRRIR
jgi:hypothetical protein